MSRKEYFTKRLTVKDGMVHCMTSKGEIIQPVRYAKSDK